MATRSTTRSKSWTPANNVGMSPGMDSSMIVSPAALHSTGRGNRRRLRRDSLDSQDSASFADDNRRVQRTPGGGLRSLKSKRSSKSLGAKPSSGDDDQDDDDEDEDEDEMQTQVATKSTTSRRKSTRRRGKPQSAHKPRSINASLMASASNATQLQLQDDESESESVNASQGGSPNAFDADMGMDVDLGSVVDGFDDSASVSSATSASSVSSTSSRGSRRSARLAAEETQQETARDTVATQKQRSTRGKARTRKTGGTRGARGQASTATSSMLSRKPGTKKSRAQKSKRAEVEEEEEEMQAEQAETDRWNQADSDSGVNQEDAAQGRRRSSEMLHNTVSRPGGFARLTATKTPKRRKRTGAGSNARVDPLLDQLYTQKGRWAKASLLDRCELLRELRESFADVSETWATALCKHHGVDETHEHYERCMAEVYGMQMLPVVRLINQYVDVLESGLECERRAQPVSFNSSAAARQSETLDNGQVRVSPHGRGDNVVTQWLRTNVQWGGTETELRLLPGCTKSQASVYCHTQPTLTQPSSGDVVQLVAPNAPSRSSGVAILINRAVNHTLVVLDVLRKLFVENQVVLVCFDESTLPSQPYFEQMLQPLVDNALVLTCAISPSSSSLSTTSTHSIRDSDLAYVCAHECVASVHLSGGSAEQHDTLVWGKTAHWQEVHKEAHEPVLKCTLSSILETNAPIVIVPGGWSADEVREMACNVAAGIVAGFSSRIVGPSFILSPVDWELRSLFFGELEYWLSQVDNQPSLDAQAEAVYADLMQRFPKTTKHHVDGNADAVCWGIIPEVDVGDPQTVAALAQLWRVPLVADMPITSHDDLAILAQQSGPSVRASSSAAAHDDKDTELQMLGDAVAGMTYLENIVWACNEQLDCSAAVAVWVHPLVEEQSGFAVETLLNHLRFSTIVVNDSVHLGHIMQSAVLGGYCGRTSVDHVHGGGASSRHNGFMFDFPEKAIVRSPLVTGAQQAFWRSPVSNADALAHVRGLVDAELQDGMAGLIGLAVSWLGLGM